MIRLPKLALPDQLDLLDFRDRVMPHVRRMRQLLRERWLDLALLGGSALSFGLFFWGSAHSEILSGLRSEVATLDGGVAERKGYATREFVAASPGERFYNMDALWTGKGQTAELRLDDGSLVHLAERTLVILKKPFKPERQRVEDKIKVVTGEIKTRESRARGEERRTQDPFAASAKEKSGEIRMKPSEAKNYNPLPDEVLYLRPPGENRLKIAWNKPLTGFLMVRNLQSGVVRYVEIRNALFAEALLSNGAGYEWRIIDGEKKTLLGPLRFELRVLDGESAKRLLKQPPQAPVVVEW